MIKFIEHESDESMLQFIVNLLYLGMKSNNVIWAEANGTQQAVRDLLSTVPSSFIEVANDILLNGLITINSKQRLANHKEVHKDIEEYQDIIDVLRGSSHEYGEYFAYICKSHFERLTRKFSVHEDPHILK